MDFHGKIHQITWQTNLSFLAHPFSKNKCGPSESGASWYASQTPPILSRIGWTSSPVNDEKKRIGRTCRSFFVGRWHKKRCGKQMIVAMSGTFAFNFLKLKIPTESPHLATLISFMLCPPWRHESLERPGGSWQDPFWGRDFGKDSKHQWRCYPKNGEFL